MFSGHETFPFRYGWLKKAVDAVRDNPAALSAEDAIIHLGVGKNMVQSMRHWALAALFVEEAGPGALKVTEFGERLVLGDPYLEDAATLWLIHWSLAARPGRAGATYLSFNHFPHAEFKKTDLVAELVRYAERQGLRAKQSTLARDVDCLLRTYLSGPRKELLEDAYGCPLLELNLLTLLADGETVQFNLGAKPNLPLGIFAFALLNFLERYAPGRSTLAVHEALYAPGSPGQVFKLDENALIELLEAVQEITAGRIELQDSTGLKQLYLRERPRPDEFLDEHYAGVRA